ncbi:MAG TPA: prenyltransferase/squalene oxidase repeat-containing protein [Planctomycetota bacterium]|nr:prenyltransferase/squalene oxidase repeat-containing protein [Planctomycetota bacterium]
MKSLTLLLVAVLLVGVSARAEDKTDLAIRRAVSFLVTQQDKDGAIQSRGMWANKTATTALAIMSMASVGHQPADESAEGHCMRKALAYILRPENQDVDGYFGNADGSRMYGHGIITLTLAELLGMGADSPQDKLITERCKAAVQLILRAQAVNKGGSDEGGWRYTPDSYDSDLSASVWQVSALRAAKNAGIEVPKRAIDRAIEYIKGTYYSPRDASGRPTDLKSACAYGVNGRAPIYSTAAAGLLSLQMCGRYEGLEVQSSADWLLETKPDPDGLWFYYGTYYYSQGMYQRGGRYADLAKKAAEDALLPRQASDGSWSATQHREVEAGTVYCTSLGVLSLAVKYHFLPIYQR